MTRTLINILVLMIIQALASCGTNYSELSFKEVADRFVTEARLHGKPLSIDNLTIKFVDEMPENFPHAVGICKWGMTPEISILKKFWIKSNAFVQENLLFHELGHCVLNRGHNYSKINDVPLSLMYPSVLPEAMYTSNREAYLKELFQ